MADRLTVFDRGSGRLYQLAQEQGFYSKNGIEVSIVPGLTAYVMAALVSMDGFATSSFGSADSSVVLLARASGLPIKCLGAISRDAVTLASRGAVKVRRPKDLEGKRIGMVQGTGEALLLPVFLKMHDVDMNKVTVADFGSSPTAKIEAGPLALVEGKIDVYGGYVSGSITDAIHLAAQKGEKIDLMAYSDFGISTYGYGIICNERFLKERRELAGRFFDSTCRFFRFVVENPRKTVDLLMEKHPDADRSVADARISAFVKDLVRPEVLKNGMAYMDLKVWAKLQDLMRRYGRLVGEVDLDDVIDLSYVSKETIPSIREKQDS